MQVLQVLFVSALVLFSILLVVRWILLSILKRVEKLPLLDDQVEPSKPTEQEKKENVSANTTLSILLSLLLLLVLAGGWIYLFQNRFWRVTVVSHLNEISVLFVSLLVLAALSIPKATRGLADFVLVVGGAVIFCAAVVAGCNLTVDFFSKPSEPTKQAEGEMYKISPSHPRVSTVAPPYNDPTKLSATWSKTVDTDIYPTMIRSTKDVWAVRWDGWEQSEKVKPVLIPSCLTGKDIRFQDHKRFWKFMSADKDGADVFIDLN